MIYRWVNNGNRLHFLFVGKWPNPVGTIREHSTGLDARKGWSILLDLPVQPVGELGEFYKPMLGAKITCEQVKARVEKYVSDCISQMAA